jgi:hypothetical protein
VIVAVGELAADSELYVLADGGLEPIVTGVDAAFDPLVHRGTVYVRTNHDAPRGAVLGLGADEFRKANGPGGFETLIPEGRDAIAEIEPAGEGVAVHETLDVERD